jgi:hypothetical protein
MSLDSGHLPSQVNLFEYIFQAVTKISQFNGVSLRGSLFLIFWLIFFSRIIFYPYLLFLFIFFWFPSPCLIKDNYAGMQVLLTAVQELFEGDTGHKMSNAETTWLTVVMGTAIVSKTCLYLYCCNFKSDIVQAYATVTWFHYSDSLLNAFSASATKSFYGMPCPWVY